MAGSSPIGGAVSRYRAYLYSVPWCT